jgi:hypothetical protein
VIVFAKQAKQLGCLFERRSRKRRRILAKFRDRLLIHEQRAPQHSVLPHQVFERSYLDGRRFARRRLLVLFARGTPAGAPTRRTRFRLAAD